ncbi:bile acid-CoA:amino acid N-acyltransferase-like [Pomacea canaliculata]|uniref:bile acid-CoA:amino acid N-acyltransferase-like n=1 Tax=Pomacea canaliculata TaxID=400727 RepID=UPI000D73CFC2|nr:bile acid-CoA:amino acid N-acyltransferase-like [Pomacea canaliculata]
MNTTSCRLLNIGKILGASPAQQQCRSTANGSSSLNLCTLSVSPSVSMFDQKVSIRIHGLPSHGMATLQAWMYQKWRGKDTLFVSYGRYYADPNGEIDLDRHPSLSGTYTGVDSMGLFWSMGSLPGHPKDIRVAIRKAQEPILINLAVFSGHITVDESSIAMKTITPLCTCTITRLFKAPDVKRIEIKEGNIRGALFLPPGNGPFLGVIDMYGGAGGLRDARAGLLATRGFAILALAYLKHQDLPEEITGIRLEYFQEAARWFSSHPAVIPDGIGVIGLSYGGMLSLCMACLCPQVKAVVNINGPPFAMHDLWHQGKLFMKQKYPDTIKSDEMGYVFIGPHEYTRENFIPVWKSETHILCLCGDDDGHSRSQWLLDLKDCYPEDKQHKINVVVYPGAGHLLEPPYTPHCLYCFSPALKQHGLWGGSPVPHATAQLDGWQRAVLFLKTILTQETKSSKVVMCSAGEKASM